MRVSNPLIDLRGRAAIVLTLVAAAYGMAAAPTSARACSEGGSLSGRVVAEEGRIDILVNNAGISGPTVPLEDYDLAVWKEIIEIDLVGVFHCCRAVVPAMPLVGGARLRPLYFAASAAVDCLAFDGAFSG